MRMAATMPDLVPSRGLRSLNGAGTDAGATGGRSKCMSGRQLARTGRVGASDNPRDMEQTAKSIRVRNAGDDLRPKPGSAQRWAGPPPVCRRHTGCPHPNNAGAAGAAFRPVVPHAPAGTKEQEWPGWPGPDGTRAEDARPCVARMTRSAIRELILRQESRISLRSIRATKDAGLF